MSSVSRKRIFDYMQQACTEEAEPLAFSVTCFCLHDSKRKNGFVFYSVRPSNCLSVCPVSPGSHLVHNGVMQYVMPCLMRLWIGSGYSSLVLWDKKELVGFYLLGLTSFCNGNLPLGTSECRSC